MLLTYALTVHLLSVQKMQLMNNSDCRSSNFKRTKKGKSKRPAASNQSLSGDVADRHTVDDYCPGRSSLASRNDSPLRRTPTISYQGPQTPRLAQLRMTKDSISSSQRQQQEIPSVELTVFSSSNNKETSKSTIELYTPGMEISFSDADHSTSAIKGADGSNNQRKPSRIDEEGHSSQDLQMIEIPAKNCGKSGAINGNPVNVPCSCAPR